MSWMWWRLCRKTERCVITRLNGHSNRSDQSVFQHLEHCEKFLETMTLYQLPDIDTDISTVNLQVHIASAVSDNWKILDSNVNWVQLCFLESFYIKRLKPKINKFGPISIKKSLKLRFRTKFYVSCMRTSIRNKNKERLLSFKIKFLKYTKLKYKFDL